jgi:DNA polymerase-3 subunit alpha
VLESLIKSGALDSTSAPRRAMLALLDRAMAVGQKAQADAMLGQGSIFDLGGPSDEPAHRHHPPITGDEFDRGELLAFEKETLGLYITSHPLADVRDQLRRKVDTPIRDLPGRPEGSSVTVGGLIAGMRTLVSKSGQPMAFLRLDDSVSQVEVVVFNSTYAQAREFLHEDAVILVKGRVERQGEGETKVKAFEVLPFDAVPLVGEVRLRVDARTAPATFIDDLARVIKDFPGESPVVVDVDTSDGRKRLRLGPGYKVRPAPDFFAEVRVLGSEAQLV